MRMRRSAVVPLSASPDRRADRGAGPYVYQRAFTVASRYLIDVEATDAAAHADQAIDAGTAIAVAKAIAEKITSTR